MNTFNSSTDLVEIYADGACKGNPGPGGWGVLMRYRGQEKTFYGGEAQTTNNRMELTAVIEALRALKRPSRVAIYTDSQYVQKGVTEWLPAWKQRGWVSSSGGKVKNQDLWRALDALITRHDIEWHWVQGHAGVAGNETADRLANLGVQQVTAEAT